MLNITIITDEIVQKGGWHGAQLAAAFATRGHGCKFVCLQDLVLDSAMPNGILNASEMPKNVKTTCNVQGVFVRGVAGGTLQQITMRLNFLHLLHLQGALVYNQAKAIERTVDKAMTSFLLQGAGIATPRTWVTESRQHAHAIIQQNFVSNQSLIIKPLFGSQGRGVRLVDASKLPLPMDAYVDGVFYLQQKITATHDFRVLIVNNQPVAAMRRSGQNWLHNVAQGATCEKSTEADVQEIAVQAAKALAIDYCGVDVIRGQDGKLWVLEINSIPAWRGLQSVTDFNIADVLADDLLQKLAFENR